MNVPLRTGFTIGKDTVLSFWEGYSQSDFYNLS